MRWMTAFAVLASVLLHLTAPPAAAGETLRGPMAKIPNLPTESDQAIEFDLTAGEIGPVELERESRFLDGVEIEIRIPDSVRPYADSFGVYILAGTWTTADENHARVSGEALLFESLPRTRRVFLQVPIHPEHRLRASADTFLASRRVEAGDFPLMLSVRPVMKGVPSAARGASFAVKVRTLFREEGAARVRLRDPDGTDITEQFDDYIEEITLTIGDHSITDPQQEIVLPTGLHQIRLQSERYVDQTETFGVERGTTQTVGITVEEETSTVSIDAPLGVEMFVNGERVDPLDRELKLVPGDYTVLFRFGEYTISRSLKIEAKRDYKVSLSLDILIEED